MRRSSGKSKMADALARLAEARKSGGRRGRDIEVSLL
jgi:hypothetical protein